MNRARAIIDALDPKDFVNRLRYPARGLDVGALKQFLKDQGYKIVRLRMGKKIVSGLIAPPPPEKFRYQDEEDFKRELENWLYDQDRTATWHSVVSLNQGGYIGIFNPDQPEGYAMTRDVPAYLKKYPNWIWFQIYGERHRPGAYEALSPKRLLKVTDQDALARFLDYHDFSEWKPGEWIYRWWPPIGQGRDIIVSKVPNGYSVSFYRLPDHNAFGNPRRWKLEDATMRTAADAQAVVTEYLSNIRALREES